MPSYTQGRVARSGQNDPSTTNGALGVMSFLSKMSDKDVLDALREIRSKATYLSDGPPRRKTPKQSHNKTILKKAYSTGANHHHRSTGRIDGADNTPQHLSSDSNDDDDGTFGVEDDGDESKTDGYTYMEAQVLEEIDNAIMSEEDANDAYYDYQNGTAMSRKVSPLLKSSGRSNNSSSFRLQMPSMGTVSMSESSTSEQDDCDSPSNLSRISGFCADGLACFGMIGKKHSDFIVSPKKSSKNRLRTTESSNEGQVSFIDSYILKQIRHQGSSLLDDNDDDDEGSNGRMSYTKSPHTSDSWSTGFKRLIKAFTGHHNDQEYDDDDETIPQVDSIVRLRKSRSDITMNTSGFGTQFSTKSIADDYTEASNNYGQREEYTSFFGLGETATGTIVTEDGRGTAQDITQCTTDEYTTTTNGDYTISTYGNVTANNTYDYGTTGTYDDNDDDDDNNNKNDIKVVNDCTATIERDNIGDENNTTVDQNTMITDYTIGTNDETTATGLKSTAYNSYYTCSTAKSSTGSSSSYSSSTADDENDDDYDDGTSEEETATLSQSYITLSTRQSNNTSVQNQNQNQHQHRHQNQNQHHQPTSYKNVTLTGSV